MLRNTLEGGFLAGLSALWFRFKACRSIIGAEFGDDGRVRILLANGYRASASEIRPDLTSLYLESVELIIGKKS